MRTEILQADSFNQLVHEMIKYLSQYPVAGYGTYFKDNISHVDFKGWTVTVTRNNTAD